MFNFYEKTNEVFMLNNYFHEDAHLGIRNKSPLE